MENKGAGERPGPEDIQRETWGHATQNEIFEKEGNAWKPAQKTNIENLQFNLSHEAFLEIPSHHCFYKSYAWKDESESIFIQWITLSMRAEPGIWKLIS